MTERELEQLERDARKPDYGAKHYKPATVLDLIAELRRLSAVLGLQREHSESLEAELEAARNVADAAVAADIAYGARDKLDALLYAEEDIDSSATLDAGYILSNAEEAAQVALDDAVCEYRKLKEGEDQ